MEILYAVLAVGLGGFLGGMGRWALSLIPRARVGTFAANMIAAVVLGIAVSGPGLVPLALGSGFAGALSTWSTLAKEIGGLARAKQWRVLTRYVLATVVIGIIAAHRGTVWAGRISGTF
ncbi:FluC/FEX family fluoride channel [Corynebacterium cystitidis]|uniref:Fluoride-specific ion channel FluC n=1 Tax=Corynebacterium cystitidis DSM 20524 TaxID=1121357 RepID=A0A1H9SFZ4_9CORY|nr:CrcB family protein [Corynebacterium cystitidis]WJY83027.1 Putative fluoride ion transporter CrcB [Corynebacterium cystitidis DSM 20524]SER83894.1 CrcB protein [Corynebacterium cystitidis DSM 20524]SNV65060.1 hypothetical membrane protein [Corynebacterium cystitidis]